MDEGQVVVSSRRNGAPVRTKQPVGTVAELRAEGLSTAQYHSCAEPMPEVGIVGCQRFHECRLSCKGRSGPHNFGVELVKPESMGGAIVPVVLDCYALAFHDNNMMENGGAVVIRAEEGEEFEVLTGETVDPLSGKVVSQYTPGAVRRDVMKKVVVPAHPRPADNPELIKDRLKTRTRVLEKERNADDKRARALGLDASVPLDKRGGRGARTEGGGKP